LSRPTFFARSLHVEADLELAMKRREEIDGLSNPERDRVKRKK